LIDFGTQTALEPLSAAEAEIKVKISSGLNKIHVASVKNIVSRQKIAKSDRSGVPTFFSKRFLPNQKLNADLVSPLTLSIA